MAEINDLYVVRLVTSMDLQTAINVRHYKVTAKVGTGATDAQIASAINTQFVATYRDMMSQAAVWRGVDVRRILPAPPGVPTAHVALANGLVLADALPAQAAFVITLRTNFAGKRYRGRVYIAFPGESDNGPNGNPTAAAFARLDLLAVKFSQTLAGVGAGGNTNDIAPVVYSKKFGLQTTIIGTTSRDRWATQRKRGGHGRPNPPPF
jgi:hypothetical protein